MKDLYYKLINKLYPPIIQLVEIEQEIIIEEEKEKSVLENILDTILTGLFGLEAV